MIQLVQNTKTTGFKKGIAILGDKKMDIKSLIDMREYKMAKLAFVSMGNYFMAYVVDEIEMLAITNSEIHENANFLIETLEYLLIKKSCNFDVPSLINYMMQDISKFKRDFQTKTMVQLICMIALEMDSNI